MDSNTKPAETTEGTKAEECSRCEKTLDTTGYPKWCKSCRAKNQREYVALKKQMAETRGYSAGVSAMREYLAGAFDGYGPVQSFGGPDIARIIRRVTGPALPVD